MLRVCFLLKESEFDKRERETGGGNWQEGLWCGVSVIFTNNKKSGFNVLFTGSL